MRRIAIISDEFFLIENIDQCYKKYFKILPLPQKKYIQRSVSHSTLLSPFFQVMVIALSRQVERESATTVLSLTPKHNFWCHVLLRLRGQRPFVPPPWHVDTKYWEQIILAFTVIISLKLLSATWLHSNQLFWCSLLLIKLKLK